MTGKRSKNQGDNSPQPNKNGKKHKLETASANVIYSLKEQYSDRLVIAELAKSYQNKRTFKNEDGLDLRFVPFQHCILPSFLADDCVTNDLLTQIIDFGTEERRNDLFSFKQSRDLRSLESLETGSYLNLNAFRTFLLTDVRKWLSEVTGIELEDSVDVSISSYGYTDFLLCHDDELEGRRIAYTYYINRATNRWSEEDGGQLCLFNSENGDPGEIVRRIGPNNNTFVFFEVTPISFHQVSEVLRNDDVIRYSISGWFHGRSLPRPDRRQAEPVMLIEPGFVELDLVCRFVNSGYLDELMQNRIRKDFVKNSSVELPDFLKKSVYDEAVDALRNVDNLFARSGPANRRSCELAIEENIPKILLDLKELFSSEAMFLTLANLTGLCGLHKLAVQDESDPDSDSSDAEDDHSGVPRCELSLRRWRHGSYTLIRDDDRHQSETALDLLLYFTKKTDGGSTGEWGEEIGGYTSYLAKGEDEELLSVEPHANCLQLVYKDKETVSFVKYVNHLATLHNSYNEFFDLNAIYYENIKRE